MSNTIIPLSKTYLEKILKPVSRITPSCVLKIKKDVLYTICSSKEGGILLYASTKLPIEFEEEIRLNILDIKKLLTGLHSLGEEGEFSIELGSNYLKIQNQDHEGFKTHLNVFLASDNLVKESVLRVDKILGLGFDTDFIIDANKAKQIVAASSFASEVGKLYFFENEGVLSAEINDKTTHNVNNITVPITNKWNGRTLDAEFPISLEIFKFLLTVKNDILVKINHDKKIFFFNVIDDTNTVELKYIVSALIK